MRFNSRRGVFIRDPKLQGKTYFQIWSHNELSDQLMDVKFLALEKNQRRGLKDVGALPFKTVASEESVDKNMLLKSSVLAMYSTWSDFSPSPIGYM